MTITFSLVALVITLFSESFKHERLMWGILSLIPMFNVLLILTFIYEVNIVYRNLVLYKEFNARVQLPIRLNIVFNDGTETSLSFIDEMIEDYMKHFILSARGKAIRKRDDILRNGYEHLGKLTLPHNIKSMEIVC